MGANSASSSSSPSAELAEFLADLSGRIGQGLLDRTEDYLVDTLGAIIFGATQPWSKVATAHALRTGADGPCTVVGATVVDRDGTTTPAMAALANGASAHAFELDDVHEEAISHPGAVVVPAALAMAQETGASGRDLLEAVAIGYEAMGRVGIAVGPASHMLSGFHPTSMSGVFGAAAAAGRLLGFDGATMNHAFGIAASLASGTMEFAASGGMAKRIHAGRAAEGGVTAALLAADGFEGATDGLAGTYGFCRIFTDDPKVERLTEGLGRRWMLDEITIKPWAACSDIHPMIQSMEELVADHDLGGVAGAARIVSIEATGPTKAAEQNNLDGTVSVMAAQYSGPWNIAAAVLADPSDPATYAPDRIADPDVAALQAKVISVEAADRWDATYAWKMGGGVKVTLDDGLVLSREVHGQRGSIHDPFSRADIEAKFTKLVGPVQAKAWLGWVARLSTKTPLTPLPLSEQNTS